MVRRNKDKEEHERLLALVPAEAQLIYVTTEKGESKYRELNDIADTDVIQVNKTGLPVVMKRKPGRPQAVSLTPANSLVAEVMKRKQEALSVDPILQVIKSNPEDIGVLQQVMVALGEEAASLGFERAEAERDGKESSNISVRRVNTLKAMVDTWLKRKDQLVSRGIDLDSKAFAVLMGFILETFREAMDGANARPELIETVFARLAKAMKDGWDNDARDKMRNVV